MGINYEGFFWVLSAFNFSLRAFSYWARFVVIFSSFACFFGSLFFILTIFALFTYTLNCTLDCYVAVMLGKNVDLFKG